MGMRTKKSHLSLVSRRMPLPSAPSTNAKGPLEVRRVEGLFRLSVGADHQIPRSLSTSKCVPDWSRWPRE